MPHLVTSMNESVFREPYLKKENEIMTTCKMAGKRCSIAPSSGWLLSPSSTCSASIMLPQLCQSPLSTLSGWTQLVHGHECLFLLCFSLSLISTDYFFLASGVPRQAIRYKFGVFYSYEWDSIMVTVWSCLWVHILGLVGICSMTNVTEKTLSTFPQEAATGGSTTLRKHTG